LILCRKFQHLILLVRWSEQGASGFLLCALSVSRVALFLFSPAACQAGFLFINHRSPPLPFPLVVGPWVGIFVGDDRRETSHGSLCTPDLFFSPSTDAAPESEFPYLFCDFLILSRSLLQFQSCRVRPPLTATVAVRVFLRRPQLSPLPPSPNTSVQAVYFSFRGLARVSSLFHLCAPHIDSTLSSCTDRLLQRPQASCFSAASLAAGGHFVLTTSTPDASGDSPDSFPGQFIPFLPPPVLPLDRP